METLAQRLKAAREKAGLSQAALAKAIGSGQSTIGSIENGRNHGSGKLLQIARALNVSADWLESGRGAMSVAAPTKAGAAEPNAYPTPAGTRVPLISWVQAGHWCEAIDPFEPGDAEDWLYCPRNHSASTFALRVRGVSMEPKYRDGAIIYVDPEKSADHLSNVIVRLVDEDEVTFKQLVIEGSKRFLRPLNPEWPGPKLIEIDASAHVCGVVIGQFIED